ncbi:MAG TPA: flagellar FlbD family protein [Clostridia bacterium]|nr:flagellar FlbD family protein [Clostridia bacterium]
MIYVTRLGGEPLVVNADLLETVEETPDTVLTLSSGRRIIVQETAVEVINRVVEFKARVVAFAQAMSAH